MNLHLQLNLSLSSIRVERGLLKRYLSTGDTELAIYSERIENPGCYKSDSADRCDGSQPRGIGQGEQVETAGEDDDPRQHQIAAPLQE